MKNEHFQVGKVETLITHIHDATWQKIETLDLNLSGNLETIKEATILSVIGRRHNNGRSLDESDFEASSDELVTEKVEDVRVRVRLCLTTDHDICGDYTEAEGIIFFSIAFNYGNNLKFFKFKFALLILKNE